MQSFISISIRNCRAGLGAIEHIFLVFLRLGNMFLKKSPCFKFIAFSTRENLPMGKFTFGKIYSFIYILNKHTHISISIDLILLILINSNARSLVHFFHFFQTSQLYKKTWLKDVIFCCTCVFLFFFFCTKLCWFSSQE